MKSLSKSIIVLIVTWAAIPFTAFAFWSLDLFTKSYDLPGVHLISIFVMCGLTATIGVLLGLTMRILFSSTNRPIFKSLLLLPPLLGFLFILWDVDWRPVYIAAFSLPIFTLVCAPKRLPVIILAVLFAFGTAALLVISETPALRFQRYANQFKTGCWCCGYRQRAMRELCTFNEQGYDVIAKTIEGDEGQIYNTSKEIYSDKDFIPLELWFSDNHPGMLRK